MKINFTDIPYADTGYFSHLVLDHLSGSGNVGRLRSFQPDMHSIKLASQSVAFSTGKRRLLVDVLKEQYADLSLHEAVHSRFDLLLNENCFTITTAHQPNIFTGPLYVIYKIAHVIKLAETANKENTGCHFIPVFYMGSEDADLEEIGTVNIGKTLHWKTDQTGAVGRMKIDAAFMNLMDELSASLTSLPYGADLSAMFRNAYRPGRSVASATRELINGLFGRFGLLIIDPDHPKLKRLFNDVVTREIDEQFSHKILSETIRTMAENYNVQTEGREINLFYLRNDFRERIVRTNDGFASGTIYQWTKPELLFEVETCPERFSTNVVLRPLFQQTILPDVAFVGGGGELAYWLELQDVFRAADVFYPPLILRNSFLLLNESDRKVMEDFSMQEMDLFLSSGTLLNNWVLRTAGTKLSLSTEIAAVEELYKKIAKKASTVDPTLVPHTSALSHLAVKKLHTLEKKLLKAEKKKFKVEEERINALKTQRFPHNNLQERVENFSIYYAEYGSSFIDMIVEHSQSTEQQFRVIYLPGGN